MWPLAVLLALLGAPTVAASYVGTLVGASGDSLIGQTCDPSLDLVPGVSAACVHRNVLYTGGVFNLAGNLTVQNFAAWDGSDWTALPSIGASITAADYVDLQDEDDDVVVNKVTGVVLDMACYDELDYLVLAGKFTELDDSSVVTSNVAFFDVASQTFSVMGPVAANVSGIQYTEEPASSFVAAVECTDATCSSLFLGGLFDLALDSYASSLAAVSVPDEGSDFGGAVASPLEQPEHSAEYSLGEDGVEGLVFALAAVEEWLLLFGGFFNVAGGDASIAMGGVWHQATGFHCLVYSSQSAVCPSEEACCQPLTNSVNAILPLGGSQYLLGGDFHDPLITVNETTLDRGVATADGLALLTLPSELSEESIGLTTLSAIGVGVDGSVNALSCLSRSSDGAFCEEIFIGGTQLLGEEDDTAAATLSAVWDGDDVSFSGLDFLSASTFGGNATVYGAMDASAIEPEAGAFIVGSFPERSNALFYASVDGVTEQLPAEADYSPDVTLDECFNSTGQRGVDFCCYAGAICPATGIQIPCPLGWGYYCGKDFEEPELCRSGFYCPTPADEIVCPKGSTCLPGTMAPEKCAWFELCNEEQLKYPNDLALVAVGAACLIILYSFIFAVQRIYLVLRDQKRRVREATARSSEVVDSSSSSSSSSLSSLSAAEVGGSNPGVELSPYGDAANGEEEKTGELSSSLSVRLPDSSFLDTQSTDPRDSVNSIASSTDDSPVSRVSVAFENLSVTLHDGRKVLYSVSGRLDPYRVCAVMGPSGCGKTTFMSALSNRIMGGGKVGGKVWVNGVEQSVTWLQDFIGFVPQEDTMLRDLTVKQCLIFYQHLKGDPTMSSRQMHSQVTEILAAFDLTHVRHSIIGDEENRGISGGQRKRVNVAIELMGNPKLLFLDEPTSGLDSTSTETLCKVLHDLALSGLTICMVIHQPRYEVLQSSIDDLLLLQRGGFTVYSGPTEHALAYFERLGASLPLHGNPADFFLDVITENLINKEVLGVDLCEAWREQGKDEIAPLRPVVEITDELQVRKYPNFIVQSTFMLLRCLVQQSNNQRVWLSDSLLLIFTGVLLGSLGGGDLQYSTATMAIGLTSVLSAIRLFGPERVVTWRERYAGVSTRGFFLGKVLSSLPMNVVAPWFFLSLYYPIGHPEVSFWAYYEILLATQLACAGLGCIISTLINPKNAQVVGVVLALIATLFAGTSPWVSELEKSIVGVIGMNISYARWCMGAIYIRRVISLPAAGLETGLELLNEIGYTDVEYRTEQVDNPTFPELEELESLYSECIHQLLVQAAVAYSIAFVALLVTSYQHTNGVSKEQLQFKVWRAWQIWCRGKSLTDMTQLLDIDTDEFLSPSELLARAKSGGGEQLARIKDRLHVPSLPTGGSDRKIHIPGLPGTKRRRGGR